MEGGPPMIPLPPSFPENLNTSHSRSKKTIWYIALGLIIVVLLVLIFMCNGKKLTTRRLANVSESKKCPPSSAVGVPLDSFSNAPTSYAPYTSGSTDAGNAPNSLQTEQIYAFVNTAACGHCVAMMPALKQASMSSPLPFTIVEASNDPNNLFQKYQINEVPTIFRLKGNTIVKEFKDSRTVENLLKFAS